MVEASFVVDGEVVTAYRRVGAGRPVVLLEDGGGAAGVLGAALAARFRVIVPDLTGVDAAGSPTEAAGRAFSTWFRGFLDGLGLTRVRLVAEPGHALAALGFALLEPDRIACVALVTRDGLEAAEADGGLSDRLAHIDRPLLVCRIGDALERHDPRRHDPERRGSEGHDPERHGQERHGPAAVEELLRFLDAETPSAARPDDPFRHR